MSYSTEGNPELDHLEHLSIQEIILGIHKQDASLVGTLFKALPQISQLAELILDHLQKGGRLFYLGAGTSGRLGILDASECAPTYGVAYDKVIGIIAGGDSAIRKAVEKAEDDANQGWKDLEAFDIQSNDIVVGISASGKTPYVLGALLSCKERGINTGAIVCNLKSQMAESATVAVEIITGPEFIQGSTRMKAGTATKMVLNMLTTSVMIKLGRVQGNKMVDMQLTNDKLIERGTKMVMEQTGLEYREAQQLLLEEGSVRKAVAHWKKWR